MGASLLEEKQRRICAGCWRRRLRWAIIAGKMLRLSGLVFMQVMILFGGEPGLWHAIRSFPLGLLVTTLALGLAATDWDDDRCAVKTDKQADSIGLILGFALGCPGWLHHDASYVHLYDSSGTVGFISRLVPMRTH